MAERAHKRKRSIEDAPADLSNLRTALNHLNALKTELAGIQEAEEELDSISKHTAALKVILKSTKQPVRLTSVRHIELCIDVIPANKFLNGHPRRPFKGWHRQEASLIPPGQNYRVTRKVYTRRKR